MNKTDQDFIIMYHGIVGRGRGIERLINVVSNNPMIKLLILGDGQQDYFEELKQQVQDKAKKQIVFHPAVPYEVLWKYVGAADVGMVTVPPICKSYYYMLPNKFMENIQSLTPIIGSDVPEIRKIIQKYEIGLLCDPFDDRSINSCIEKMRTDKVFYNKCKKNLKIAKEELCWENEKGQLVEAWKKFILKN